METFFKIFSLQTLLALTPPAHPINETVIKTCSSGVDEIAYLERILFCLVHNSGSSLDPTTLQDAPVLFSLSASEDKKV